MLRGPLTQAGRIQVVENLDGYYGTFGVAFEHPPLLLARSLELLCARYFLLGFAELPLRALPAVGHRLADVGEVEPPELAAPGFAAALDTAKPIVAFDRP